jgi:hypothetical protein
MSNLMFVHHQIIRLKTIGAHIQMLILTRDKLGRKHIITMAILIMFNQRKLFIITNGFNNDSDEVFKGNLYTNFNIMEYYIPGVMQIIFGKIDAKSALNNILNSTNPQWN